MWRLVWRFNKLPATNPVSKPIPGHMHTKARQQHLQVFQSLPVLSSSPALGAVPKQNKSVPKHGFLCILNCESDIYLWIVDLCFHLVATSDLLIFVLTLYLLVSCWSLFSPCNFKRTFMILFWRAGLAPNTFEMKMKCEYWDLITTDSCSVAVFAVGCAVSRNVNLICTCDLVTWFRPEMTLCDWPVVWYRESINQSINQPPRRQLGAEQAQQNQNTSDQM